MNISVYLLDHFIVRHIKMFLLKYLFIEIIRIILFSKIKLISNTYRVFKLCVHNLTDYNALDNHHWDHGLILQYNISNASLKKCHVHFSLIVIHLHLLAEKIDQPLFISIGCWWSLFYRTFFLTFWTVSFTSNLYVA